MIRLSKRVEAAIASPSKIMTSHSRCIPDLYHKQQNPNGYLNLGTSENYLTYDLLQEKLAEGAALSESDIHYNTMYGLADTRQVVADFIAGFFNHRVDPEHIIIANGVTSIIDMWAFAFCNPGDVVLIPSPYYPGFKTDLELRAQVQVRRVPTLSDEGYQLSLASLKLAHQRAEAEGLKVRGLIITTPGNPVGRALSAEEMQDVAEYLRQFEVPCLFDEIYGLSFFGAGDFYSSFELAKQYPELKEQIHFTYGLSKDLGLSGLRVGFFHSFSGAALSAMQSLSYFNHIPTDTQRLTITVLKDHVWLKDQFKTIQERLKAAHQNFAVQEYLPTWPADGGFFAWCDARSYLTEKTFAAEARLYEELMTEAKINMLPGAYFEASEPGWFRACIARPTDYLEVGVERLRKFFGSRKRL